jgi:hypothetical protein
MQPYFAQHRVFVRRGLTAFINELTTYDGVKAHQHFDLLDALAQAATLNPYPSAFTFEQETEAKETQWHEGVKTLATQGAGSELDRRIASGRWTGC